MVFPVPDDALAHVRGRIFLARCPSAGHGFERCAIHGLLDGGGVGVDLEEFEEGSRAGDGVGSECFVGDLDVLTGSLVAFLPSVNQIGEPVSLGEVRGVLGKGLELVTLAFAIQMRPAGDTRIAAVTNDVNELGLRKELSKQWDGVGVLRGLLTDGGDGIRIRFGLDEADEDLVDQESTDAQQVIPEGLVGCIHPI